MEAILCNDGQLRISSQFYFYVLARYVLRDAGISRSQTVAITSVRCSRTFSRAQSPARAHTSRRRIGRAISLRYVDRAFPRHHRTKLSCCARTSGITRSSSAESFMRTPSGAACAVRPTSAFTKISDGAIFNSSLLTRPRGAASLNDVYAELADRFHDVRLALNQLADRLLNLDEGDRATRCYERNPLQPDPAPLRTDLRAGRDQSRRLPD